MTGASLLEGRGRETSLAGAAFEVRSGEVLAIVGAPADGLNLLHEVLLGQRAPARGSIQFLGKEIAATDRRQRVDAGMSFVNPPQARDQSLSHFTVEENLILGQTRRGPFTRRGWLKFESIRGNAVRSLQLVLGLEGVSEVVVVCSVRHFPRARFLFDRLYRRHGYAVSYCYVARPAPWGWNRPGLTSAHASNVAPVVLTSSISTTTEPTSTWASLVAAKA